ncbi:MAG: hypothetical protein CMJ78_11490 [Planctomycetaceae bacterium]|nr:hypothetical protein [Planctomycetaceae bacterium]
MTRSVGTADGYGEATLDPSGPIIAGSVGTWRLTYTVGEHGLATAARIRIRTDTDTDWGTPQFIDPTGDDFASLSAPAGSDCTLQVGNPKSLTISVQGRPLVAGEQITLTLGDTTGGSSGSRAQTFLETTHTFLFEVDAKADGQSVLLGESPQTLVLGGDAVRLVLVAPSEVAVGQEFRLLIKAEDAWGNSSSTFEGTVNLELNGIRAESDTIQFAQNQDDLPMHRGVVRVDGLTAEKTGVLRIQAECGELSVTSNPIVVTEEANPYQLQWADPHGGQVGSATKIADFFRYARDVSGIQFVGYQRNADVISAEDWDIQQAAEKELFEPGNFIPIPGFEWSGRTPEGGHHNMYLRRHDQPVRRNPPAEAPAAIEPETALPHIRDVYHAYRNTDTIITPHVGGEHSNLTWHDPTLEPAMEMSSSHGSFEWVIREILERGYQLGFLGGSDCYTGRPGDDRPGHQLRRYAKSALTGIYTQDIALEGFFEAMRARRVYATTGARIVLKVDSNGHWLGEKYTTTNVPKLSVQVIGTAPIESIEVFRGLEKVHEHAFDHKATSNRLRLTWSGASRMSSYSGIVWDGDLTVADGTLGGLQSLRFDSPRSSAAIDQDQLSWNAWGCGYPMGLAFDIDANEDAAIRVSVESQMMTGPMYGAHGEKGPPRRVSFSAADHTLLSTSLAQLQDGPRRLDLGILDRWIQLSLEQEMTTDFVDFEFTDEDAKPGINSYWIKVLQSDLEMAWSSPLYVDYVKR